MKKPEMRTIFTGLAILGVIGTGVLSALGGFKNKDAIDNDLALGHKPEKKNYVKYYIPAAVAAVATSYCAIKSHTISSAEIAVLTSAGAYLAANRDYLERKLKENVSEEKLQEIKKMFAVENTVDKLNEQYPAEETGKGNTLFFEAYSGRMFRSSYKDVDEAIIAFKRSFEGYDGEDRNYVCLNDFYELLGIKGTHFGYQYGWAPNNDFCDNEIVFEVTHFSPEDIKKVSADAFKTGMYSGYENIKEDFYVIELTPMSYPIPYWQEI